MSPDEMYITSCILFTALLTVLCIRRAIRDKDQLQGPKKTELP